MGLTMRRLLIGIAASVAALSWCGGVLAFGSRAKSFEQRYLERNCAWCHGPSFQGFTSAPRLAGQKAGYIERQITDFQAHARDNPLSRHVMWGAARPISPEVAGEIAAYLSSLDAEAANDGHEELVEKGRAIYQVGDGAQNVPSCVVCHGPQGQGTGAIPRIGGLSYEYLKRRLERWGEGYHASAAFPMPAVAGQLSDYEIDAIASYLSFEK
jgi:cytochrome c553